GNTLYTINSIFGPGMQAFDTATLAQKGWVASFNIADYTQTIIPGAIDETGLIAGPIGHGVAFVDGGRINPGSSATLFNLGFLSPNSGPSTVGTLVQAEVLTVQPPPAITGGQFYVGRGLVKNAAISATSVSGITPITIPGSA